MNRLLSQHGYAVDLLLGILLIVVFFFDGRWGVVALGAGLLFLGVGAGTLRSLRLGPTQVSVEFWKQAVAERAVERSSAIPQADKQNAADNIPSAATPAQFVDRIVAAVERGEVSVHLRVESISLSATQFRSGQHVAVSLRATASPVDIDRVVVCYGRVGIGAFRACPSMVLVAGTPRDRTWSGTFELDPRWPAGTWNLQEAAIRNAFGYGSSIDPADWIRQGGGGGTFTVEARS